MLRGGETSELKAVKRVVWLAVNVAYNLRLEVSYLNDRRACLVPSLLPSFSSTSETAVAAALAAVASSGEAALLRQDTDDDDGDKDGGGGGSDQDDSSDAEYEDSRSSSGAAGAGADVYTAAAKSIPARFLEAAGTAVRVPPVFPSPAADGGGGGVLRPTAAASGTGGGQGPRAVRTGFEPTTTTAAARGEREAKDEGSDYDDSDDGDGDDDTGIVLNQPAMLSSSLGVDFGESPPFLQLHKGTHGGGTAARKFLESNRTAAAAGAAAAAAWDDKSRAPSGTAGAGPGAGSAAAVVRTGGGGGRGYVFGSEHFAYQNQNLMITSLWMTQGSQCCNADLKFFRYYKHKHVRVSRSRRRVVWCGCRGR